MEVRFYDSVENGRIKFAVIIARSDGKWVFCKHRERNTLELPGGHRESGESIEVTAERELREETGALDFSIEPVCVYSVTGKNRVNSSGEETFGMLYTAEITKFGELDSEIEHIGLTDELPQSWTYPEIQPGLIAEAQRRGVV